MASVSNKSVGGANYDRERSAHAFNKVFHHLPQYFGNVPLQPPPEPRFRFPNPPSQAVDASGLYHPMSSQHSFALAQLLENEGPHALSPAHLPTTDPRSPHYIHPSRRSHYGDAPPPIDLSHHSWHGGDDSGSSDNEAETPPHSAARSGFFHRPLRSRLPSGLSGAGETLTLSSSSTPTAGVRSHNSWAPSRSKKSGAGSLRSETISLGTSTAPSRRRAASSVGAGGSFYEVGSHPSEEEEDSSEEGSVGRGMGGWMAGRR
ncbi:hypothetical protein JCM6882_002221 [Rhodosporidiobolus microsporus]